MLDDETNQLIRGELLKLTRTGDLLALARELRESGLESLLLCHPSGRIQQVVTDRQIAHYSADPDPAPMGRSNFSAVSAGEEPFQEYIEPVTIVPAIPRQGVSARFGQSLPASRS